MSDWKEMREEDNFRLVVPSTAYSFERYGAAFYQIAYTPPSSSGGADPNLHVPEVYAYQPADAIWKTMGVKPPESNKLVGPLVPGTGKEYKAWKAADDKQQASYRELNQAIGAFNKDLRSRMVGEWSIYDGTEQIARTKVTKSDPGMIHIGGKLRFNSQAVNNRNSQIIAGGDNTGNKVLGTQAVNNGVSGIQTVTTTGTGSYTFIKSFSTRADERREQSIPYEGQSIQTSFTLDITPTNGIGAQQDKTLKSIAVLGDMVVRTSNPDTSLPASGLFVAGNDRYLIATDPQLIHYRSWLSSDDMLTRLSHDPDLAMKRIGDGFYEQQLVQQQIQKAIGQRYPGNTTSNEAHY